MTNIYTPRDIQEQGDHYLRHVEAIRSGELVMMSSTAAELAHRDIEIERLRAAADNFQMAYRLKCDAENKELHALNETLADLLRRTMLAIRGPEPELTHWDWSDMPERAAAEVTSRKAAQAEAEALKARLAHSGVEAQHTASPLTE